MPKEKAGSKVPETVVTKVAKKAAKKSAKGLGHDARRAYEHLHRLRLLHRMVSSEVNAQMIELSHLAQAAFRADEGKSAADLLRAAEHLAFGSSASETEDTHVHKALKQEMRDEFDHLMEKAAEQWDKQDAKPAEEVKTIYKAMRSEAKAAWKAKAYHRALEFARGAGALANTRTKGLKLALAGGSEPAELEQ